MSIQIPIKVGYQSVKEATAETQKLKQKLVDVGSMNTTIHARMDTAHGGSQAIFMQQNRAIQQSIDKLMRGGASSSSWSNNPDGSRTYTSPGGVRYGYSPPGGSNAGSTTGNDGFNFTGLAKAAFPYLLAGMGIGSLKAMMVDAKEQAKIFELSRIDLSMRGYTATDSRLKDAAKLGYTPLEQSEIATTLNRTGLTGKHLDQLIGTAMYQGRGTAVGGQSIASYMEKVFPFIQRTTVDKLGERLNTPILNLYKAATAFGQGSRYQEILASNQQAISALVSARGGEGLDSQGLSKLSLLQMGLWKTGKIGEGQSGIKLMAGLDQGIRAGGSDPGSRIFMAQALGIDKVTNLSNLWDFKLRQSRGASDLQNIIGVFNQSQKITDAHGLKGTEAAAMQKLTLESALGTLQPYQIEALSQPEFQKFIRQASINPKAAWATFQESPEYKRLLNSDKSTAEWMKSLGAQAMAANAGEMVAELPAGRKLLQLGNTGKDAVTGALDLGDKLLDNGLPPSMTVPVNEQTSEQLEQNINYLTVRPNNPRLLESLKKRQKELWSTGVDMTYMRQSSPASTSAASVVTSNTEGISPVQTSEVTRRLDTMIDILSGKHFTPSQPTGLDSRFK